MRAGKLSSLPIGGSGFIPVPLEALESETYLGAEPTDRATWLALLAYSFRRLNGGRIAGAAAWPGRKLERVLGVTAAELGRGFTADLEPTPAAAAPVENSRLPVENSRLPVENSAPTCGNLWKTPRAKMAVMENPKYVDSLWGIIGDDIVIKFYPYDFEKKILASKKNGRLGGRPKRPK